MDLVSKYPSLIAAVRRPDSELREDLRRAIAIVEESPNSAEGGRAAIVQSWIGQALRLRTPGLNGPLAWQGRPLAVRVPPLP